MSAEREYASIQHLYKLADERMANLLRNAVEDLVEKHEGLRAASRASKIDLAYLQRLRSGEKVNPSPATLKKLGIKIK